MTLLLVLIVCLMGGPSYGFNVSGKKLPSPPTAIPQNYNGNFFRTQTRMAFQPRRGIRHDYPKIIFLKHLLEMECLKDIYNHNRPERPLGVAKHTETTRRGRPQSSLNEGQDVQRKRGNPIKSPRLDGTYPGNRKIIFLPSHFPSVPERLVMASNASQNRGDNNNLHEDVPKEEEATKNNAQAGEKNSRLPQVFPSAGEIDETSVENVKVLSEDFPTMISFGDNILSDFSQNPQKTKPTTAVYPENSSFHFWHFTRPHSIQPYEVEEVLEENLKINLEDEKTADTKHFREKLFGTGYKGNKKEENVENRQAGAIDDSINTILRGLISPTVKLYLESDQEKASPSWPAHHEEKSLLPSKKGLPKEKHRMETDGKNLSTPGGVRIENHRSINFTPFESVEYQRDFYSLETLPDKTSTAPSLYLAHTRPQLNDLKETSPSNLENPKNFISLFKSLATKKNDSSETIPMLTAKMKTPTTVSSVSYSITELLTPEPILSNTSEVFLAKDTLTEDFKTNVEHFETRVTDVEFTTKEFTDNPLNFDLLPTTKKEEGNWKNSRKMHFRTIPKKIIVPKNIESEQRRSDILITDGLGDYGDGENQLPTLGYLERIKSNGSLPYDPWALGMESLIPLIPRVIDDLRGDKISPEDVTILSEAFSHYWPHILALSNYTNLDMLPLLKMKDEKDLDNILKNLFLENSQPVMSSGSQEQPKNTDYSQSYDYMEEYKDLYKDIIEQEIEDAKKLYRSKRDDDNDLKRIEAIREYFESIRQEQNDEGRDYMYEDAFYDELSEQDASVFELTEVAGFHLNIRNGTPRQK